MNISEFLADHLIAKIGIDLPKYICTEVIVDKPEDFILLVLQNDCYISSVFWWERVKIGAEPQLGYGGQYDPKDPSRFYYSETDISDSFIDTTTAYEYQRYLNEISCAYPSIELFPAFEVRKK